MAATDIASHVSEGEVSLPEIVFSCGSCQATPPELYAKRESNRGFHSGSGDEDGIVVKLWIADCSHITCNKHLPGGGTSYAYTTDPYYLLTKSLAVPFHLKGQPPKAQCPQCVENGDSEVKSLYPIRGLQDGEFDEQIPKEWLRCPPIKLDGEIPGMEALRFQYMNISRYAIRITKHWKSTAAKQSVMESAYGKERKQRRHIQNEVLDLKSKIEELEKCETRLAKWESRKPIINHYLGIVGDMAKEIKTLRDQLAELGYDSAGQDFMFTMASWDGNQTPRIYDNTEHPRHQTNSIHSRNAITEEQQQTSSARKRKLSELADGHNYHDPPLSRTNHRMSSRDLMPPPLPKPKPSQQLRSPSDVQSRAVGSLWRTSSRQPVQSADTALSTIAFTNKAE
ncbi:hypothetical protein D0862_05885 [Hortaea werneckii]|uniref:Uncharacterized protein n=1 Tax=Hortaea werneckii TaxID=91943 RepID=A0A3M7GNW3_HORWE|nr:hypothetical protein D0862_05885 [Hortaea werneckii]